MTHSRRRVDHQVPITSPEMFTAPYPDIPVDRSDPRGREPLVRLESVGVAFECYYARAKQENPGGSDQEHRGRARQLIVDPASFDENDPRTWPAHTNGAAVDLTLRDSVTKQLLDMGANFEEDSDSAASAGDYFEREMAAGRIDENDLKLQNRRLLNWAMTGEGLLNETAKVFWHYDWGNQIYVRASRALLLNPPEAAWYGYIDLPK